MNKIDFFLKLAENMLERGELSIGILTIEDILNVILIELKR
jgi:hypothetical protein